MKTLKDYTPEIKAKIPFYKDKCVKDLYSGKEYEEWKKEYTIEYVEYLYELANREKPVVIIADTIYEYKTFYNLLFNDKLNKEYTEMVSLLWEMRNKKDYNKSLGTVSSLSTEIETKLDAQFAEGVDLKDLDTPKYHYLFLCSEYSRGYLMWYKFIKDEFQIECSKGKELDKLYDLVHKANIAKGFFCEKVVLILRMPKKIIRNEIGFHSTSSEGAIQYDDQKMFYINGRKMESWVFEKYFTGKLKFEDFAKETNEDIRAGIITLIKENEGNEGLLKFLNAVEVDTKVVKHTDDYQETLKIYQTKEKYEFLQNSKGESNQPYAWIQMKCPSTGQIYLIDTCPTFTDAVECAKWHRPKEVNLSIPYVWQSAN